MMRELSEKMVEEYSLSLLNWAYRKTGDKDKAEELVQEVWVQVFSAVKRNEDREMVIENGEHFIWKIAHYVWCHYLRNKARSRRYVPADELEIADERDFVNELSENEEMKMLISYMRKCVMNLNRLQREIMIAFYIEGLPQKEIARRLQVTESTVKWHLFDARKRVKEEISGMKETAFVYRPNTMAMAYCGEAVMVNHTEIIDTSLSKQNICIACYNVPRTLDNLSEQLGIPKVYLEYDLEWLVKNEFVCETKKGYSTNFVIETWAQEQKKYAVYLKHKERLSDVMIEELLKAEDRIRAIGFAGCDMPMEKLLWLLIYRCGNNLRLPDYWDEPPVRYDGGKYYSFGYPRMEDGTYDPVLDTKGWAYNGGMWNDNFWWFGLYNFGNSEVQELIWKTSAEWQRMSDVLKRCMENKTAVDTADEEEKYLIAKLVEKNFVRIENGCVVPNFCVFTDSQYQELQETVFEPIEKLLWNEVEVLAKELEELYDGMLPGHLKKYRRQAVWNALMDIVFVTEILAFQDGKLYVPGDVREGGMLTLMYVKG